MSTLPIERMLTLQNMFLIGGFAESPYLVEELEYSFKELREIQLLRPETS